MKRRITVFISIIVLTVIIFSVIDQSEKVTREQAVIFGVVTDTNGIALKGVEVAARSMSMGGNLQQLVRPTTFTDVNGCFALSVDFPDILYFVSFNHLMCIPDEIEIIPTEAEPLLVKLQKKPSRIIRGRTIFDPFGTPISGAIVKYYSKNYNYVAETRSNDDGFYEFELPSYASNGAIFAEQYELISSLLRIPDSYSEKLFPELKLREYSDEVWGFVRNNKTNKVIPNCIVVLTSKDMKNFSRRMSTDKNGMFRFKKLPPSSYNLEIVNSDYIKFTDKNIPPHGRTDILVQKMVTFKGKVVDHKGKPVAGAVVAIDDKTARNNEYPKYVVRTDKKGKFIIKTGMIESNPPKKKKGLKALVQIFTNLFDKSPGRNAIEAFHSQEGYGTYKFSPYEEGKVVKGIKIILKGSYRIHGKITDPNNNPIEGVTLYASRQPNLSAITDIQGRFDVGKIPILPPDIKKTTLYAYPPRPSTPVFTTGQSDGISDTETIANKAEFFHYYQKSYNIEPGKSIELNITLEPTDLITLYGTVTDSNGIKVENAEILLFVGNANPNTWAQRFYQDKRSSIFFVDTATLHDTKTDKEGSWEIVIPRESAEDIRIVHQTNVISGHYSIGAYKNINEHVLIQNIVIEPNETEKEIDIKISKSNQSKQIQRIF